MGFQQRRTAPAQIRVGSPDITLSLGGVAATAAVGAVAVAFSVGLTGLSSAASVGTPAPAFNISVTGNSSTTAVGTLNPAFNLTLLGNSSATSVGTLAPSFSKTLTGNSSTSGIGTVGPTFGLGITGNSSTTGTGTAAVSFGVGTTGNQSGGATGIFLEGVSAATAVGALGVKFDIATLGNQSATAVGTLAPSFNKTLTGNSSTSGVGTAGVTFGVPLTGDVATSGVGTVAPGSAGNIGITGVSTSGSAGAVASTFGIGSTGSQSNCSAGSAGNQHTRGLTGDIASGSVGTIAVQGASGDATIALTGVQSSGLVGICAADFAVKIRAQFASLGEPFGPSNQPSGQVVTYGNLGPYAQQVILDGATNYWRLDDPVASPITIRDFVGGVHATVSGNTGLQVRGALGDGNTARNVFYALDFTNILPNPPGVIVDALVQTMEGWIFLRSFNAEAILFGDTGFGMSLGIGTNGLIFFQGVATTLVGVTPVTLGVWHHLVVTKDLTNRRLYLDGVPEVTDTLVDDWVGSPNGGNGPGNRFQYCQRRTSAKPDATMDEIAFYRGIALSAAQVANHYALAPRKMPSVTPGVAFKLANDFIATQTVQQPVLNELVEQATFDQVVTQAEFTETFEG